MTLKQIRDAILAIVGNDTEIQIADYNTFINEGKRYIESKILKERQDFFPDTETATLTASDTKYTPTKTWNNITLVRIDYGNGYVVMDKKSLNEVLSSTVTNNNIFHLWGTDLYFPSITSTATIEIFGYVLPPALVADNSEPMFSELLHASLITWGVGRAIESSSASENFLDGQRKRAEFYDLVEQILPSVILKDMTNVKSLI